MSAPNIVSVSSILGKTVANTPPTNTATVLLANQPNSSQVFKINTITASNLDGSSAINCSVAYNTGVSGNGTNYFIANTISVPASATLIVIDKSTSFYLEENTSIMITSGTASKLAFLASYEIIS